MKVHSMSGPTNLSQFSAIETIYRKYNFRSRLEAKWATFFDLCGWNWSYEPPEFDGYIPDFVIGDRPTLVEIKPFYHQSDWKEAIAKIISSGCRQSVICLGSDPTWISVELTEDFDPAPAIAWLAHPLLIDGQPDYEMQRLHFGFTEGNRKLGLCPMSDGWVNAIWQTPRNIQYGNKWSRVELEKVDYEKHLVERWATCHNATKWMPK